MKVSRIGIIEMISLSFVASQEYKAFYSSKKNRTDFIYVESKYWKHSSGTSIIIGQVAVITVSKRVCKKTYTNLYQLIVITIGASSFTATASDSVSALAIAFVKFEFQFHNQFDTQLSQTVKIRESIGLTKKSILNL